MESEFPGKFSHYVLNTCTYKVHTIPCRGLRGVVTEGLTDWRLGQKHYTHSNFIAWGMITLCNTQEIFFLTCLYSRRFEKWSLTSHERL